MKVNRFQDLEVWKVSVDLAKEIYIVTQLPAFLKDYSFKDQIRRAVVSISSNIAEGFERNNNNEFIQFLKITKGSIGELRSQLYIAKEIKYINTDKFVDLDLRLHTLSLQVGKFLSYLIKVRKNAEFPKQ